jgi:HD-GYP domain-containing protein (c-di-GMP phosphodiesterase class II)
VALHLRRPLAIGLLVAAASLLPLTLSRSAAGGAWSAPEVQLWFVVFGAGLCVVLSVVLLFVARRRRAGEIAILATSLTVLGTLATAHGLATPGVLFDRGDAASAAGLLALPLAVLAALPLVLPAGPAERRLGAHWRGWTDAWVIAGVLVATVALFADHGGFGPVGKLVLAGIGIGGALALAGRQLRLYLIGRRTASLVTTVALATLAAGAATGLVAALGSPAWWTAQTFDLVAVVAAVVSLALVLRSGRSIDVMLAPIVNRDPLLALELGLAPEVHAFVAALDRKDEISRDHVVRVADLAMRVGTRAGLPPGRLRTLGLGAMLHDIGKLVVPSDILAKPGSLTDEEWSVMRTHAERGAALLDRSSTLRDVARLVRSHHERPDGSGYPDGLRGDEISGEVGIISACDAFDAMTNTRQYRGGMPRGQAARILASGAGTQWSPAAVNLLLAELDAEATDRPAAFRTAGRDREWQPREIEAFLGVCTDAIPPELRTPEPQQTAPPVARSVAVSAGPSSATRGENASAPSRSEPHDQTLRSGDD